MQLAFEKAGIVPIPEVVPETKPIEIAQEPHPEQPALGYVDRAEQVINMLRSDPHYRNFTVSKIRNILAMVNDIYNDVFIQTEPTLTKDTLNKIQRLRIRLVYECGREPIIRSFTDTGKLLEEIAKIGNQKDKYIAFSRYMEALVAYHRYYGGND
jgi:CRISPR-associated protein Csm2